MFYEIAITKSLLSGKSMKTVVKSNSTEAHEYIPDIRQKSLLEPTHNMLYIKHLHKNILG